MNNTQNICGKLEIQHKYPEKSAVKAVKIGNGQVTGNVLAGYAAHYYLLDLQESLYFPEIRVSTDQGFAGLSYEVELLKNGRVLGDRLVITQSSDDPAFFLDGGGGDALLVGVRNMTPNTIAYNLNIKQLGVDPSRENYMPRFGDVYMQNQNLQRNFIFHP